MSTFRLKVRTTEIDLPLGELSIGRGSDCFLRIDDDLVSRLHARLLVTEHNVSFEDLGSRNGSLLNGKKTTGVTPLKLHDSFEVGAQIFQLLVGPRGDRNAFQTMISARTCRSCRSIVEASAVQCGACGDVFGEAQPSTVDFEREAHTDGFAASFGLVTGLADKLLALGRADEAERMIGPRLRDLLARTRGGERVEEALIAEALRRGVRLAGITSRDEWYVWVFELARHAQARIESKLLDELHGQMLVHKPLAAEALTQYHAAQAGDDADTQLFRKRLEALLRFCRTQPR